MFTHLSNKADSVRTWRGYKSRNVEASRIKLAAQKISTITRWSPKISHQFSIWANVRYGHSLPSCFKVMVWNNGVIMMSEWSWPLTFWYEMSVLHRFIWLKMFVTFCYYFHQGGCVSTLVYLLHRTDLHEGWTQDGSKHRIDPITCWCWSR